MDRTVVAAVFLNALVFVLSVPSVGAEVVQRQGVRVSVTGSMAPRKLPRRGRAPVSVTIGGRIFSTASDGPPKLERLVIAINSHGRLSTDGIPRCRLHHIDPSTTAEAREACAGSLIGEGHFSADVRLPEQSPFPSRGKVLAFNGRLRGQPAIFAHIYGTRPVPTSYVLPFLIRRTRGTYGTMLEASFPKVTGEWGFVTGLSLNLNGSGSFPSGAGGYLSAGCPAPKGSSIALFPLMRTTFSFAGGPALDSVLTSTCTVGR
jgi:hypothetical protein